MAPVTLKGLNDCQPCPLRHMKLPSSSLRITNCSTRMVVTRSCVLYSLAAGLPHTALLGR